MIFFKNWEDVMDSSLCYLLRGVLAKSDKDRLRTSQSCFEEVKDVSRVEKHCIQVIERINKNETQEHEEIGIFFSVIIFPLNFFIWACFVSFFPYFHQFL